MTNKNQSQHKKVKKCTWRKKKKKEWYFIFDFCRGRTEKRGILGWQRNLDTGFEKEYTSSDKKMSDKSDETFLRWRKLCQTNNIA